MTTIKKLYEEGDEQAGGGEAAVEEVTGNLAPPIEEKRGRGRPPGTTKKKPEIGGDDEERIISSPSSEAVLEDMPDIFTQNPMRDAVIERPNAIDSRTSSASSSGSETPGEEIQTGAPTESMSSSEAPSSSSGKAGNVGDLPPGVRNKAINKTSELMANAYQQILPGAAKFIAKTSETKITKLHVEGKLDANQTWDFPDMPGASLLQYIHAINATADEHIKITDEQKLEFQEALKDVLAEKQVAMTPMERLLTVVGLHVVALGQVAITLKVKSNQTVGYIKGIYEEMKKNGGMPPPAQEETHEQPHAAEPPTATVTPPPTSEVPATDVATADAPPNENLQPPYEIMSEIPAEQLKSDRNTLGNG